MPYIKQEDRANFVALAKELGTRATCAGDLNFIMTVILQEWIKKNGLRYSFINEAIGSLECCKLELYRRIASPYEDTKIQENGDVLS